MTTPPTERRRWLDEPRHVTWIYRTLVAVCLMLAAVDFVFTKLGHVTWERWIGFYALYGFLSCVALVMVAKGLRKLVMRREDYYDR